MNSVHNVNAKYRDKTSLKQYKNLKDPEIPKESPREFSQRIVSGLCQSKLDSLGSLVQLWARFQFVCVSQATLGKKVARCARTAVRHIEEFRKLGLITSLQRYNNSCLYKVNPMLMVPEVRGTFACKSKKWACVSFLIMLAARDLVGDVRLGLSNIYINKPPVYVYPSSGDQKGGVPVRPAEISTTLKSITCLKLTRWGQIRLACYPDEALLHAQKQMKCNVGRIDDPFSWFKTVCERYCFEKNIRILHDRVHELRKLFPEPQSARMLMDPVQSQSSEVISSSPVESIIHDPGVRYLLGGSPVIPSAPSMSDEKNIALQERISQRKILRGIKP